MASRMALVLLLAAAALAPAGARGSALITKSSTPTAGGQPLPSSGASSTYQPSGASSTLAPAPSVASSTFAPQPSGASGSVAPQASTSKTPSPSAGGSGPVPTTLPASGTFAPRPTLSPTYRPSPSGNSSGNGTAPGDSLTAVLPSWWEPVAASALMVLGLVEVAAGYRYFRSTMVVVGFLAAWVPTFLFVYAWLKDDSSLMGSGTNNAFYASIGTSVVTGLLCAALCFFLVKVAVFVIGAGLGVVVAVVLNVTVFAHLSLPESAANVPLIVGSIALGIGLGVLALYAMRPTVVTATSTIGAFCFIYGIGLLAGNFPSNVVTYASQVAAGTTSLQPVIYGYFAGFLLFTLLGLGLQFFVTAKKARADEKDEFERAYEEAEMTLEALTGRKKKGKKGKDGKKKGKGKDKGKKGKKGRVAAAALLADYEPGGEFYEPAGGGGGRGGYGGGGDGYYEESGYGDDSYAYDDGASYYGGGEDGGYYGGGYDDGYGGGGGGDPAPAEAPKKKGILGGLFTRSSRGGGGGGGGGGSKSRRQSAAGEVTW